MIIDAHQHFWDPACDPYPWMTGPAAPLRRIFAPDDLRPELRSAGVDATILVQTRSSIEETQAFLSLVANTPFIAGVVGWVDLQCHAVHETISGLRTGPGGEYLVGVRHQVHDEPDPNWLLRPAVQRGLRAVAEQGLAYDLLIRPREIAAAVTAVQNHPTLRFVVNHLAKPHIANCRHHDWAEAMQAFRPHRARVWCKLSGMITEADWAAWTNADLAPYIATALDIFGPNRCLFGSDWPVCTLAGTYRQTFDALRANLDPAIRSQIFAASAAEAYGLARRRPMPGASARRLPRP